jgi:CubicO group peptidase (beta-lactamase class C family)
MTTVLERESPFWEAGTRTGYHALTFGWLVGEVVRRVAGESLGSFFRKEVASPLGLDFWIGLPEQIEPRVARIIPSDPAESDARHPFYMATADPESIQSLLLSNCGGYLSRRSYDSREAHAAEVGAAGGITNARGLAGMYSPLACGGRPLVDPEAVSRMSAPSSATETDAMLLVSTRFSLGFMKSTDNRPRRCAVNSSVILSEHAFGHVGFGGSIGFADPKCGMSFAYTMNRLGGGFCLNERGQSLVDAAYRSLGCATDSVA